MHNRVHVAFQFESNYLDMWRRGGVHNNKDVGIDMFNLVTYLN